MAISYELDVAEILGYIGGVVLAVALAPQVKHTLKTRSTKDISYGWQLIYIFGLILNFVYFIMIHATAAWVTMTIELGFALWLLILKIHFDGFGRETDTTESDEHSQDAIKDVESQKSGPTHGQLEA